MRLALSWQFVRFLAVGVVNTLTGLSVIYLATWLFQFGDVVANAIGYGLGLMVSFTLNSRWTFKYGGPKLRALASFLLVSAIAYAANLLTVIVAIRVFDVNAYLAQALGMPPFTITSYLLSKHVVFAAPRTPAAKDARQNE